jgi:Xaa-Pro aminopeptidase
MKDKRISDAVTATLSKNRLDALLVSGVTNVQYLTEFTGDSTYVLLTGKKSFLITDFRYTEQAEDEVSAGCVVIEHKKGLADKVAELVKKYRIKRLGIEAHQMTCAIYRDLKKRLPSFTKVKLTQNLIEKIREIKTGKEIEKIRCAIECSQKAFLGAKKLIKPGISEETIATEMWRIMCKNGSPGPSFPTIVAADKRASLPHARATDNKIKKPGLVQFDWGSCFNQYVSDTSRMVFLDKPSAFWKNIYDIVHEAQERALACVKPGAPLIEIDKAARQYIISKGYGENFGHGLGHGVGRNVHELPGIPNFTKAQNKKNKAVLKPGMVFTIEPGIYIEGKGGVRIEDMVLVTETGYEIMTKSIPKSLEQSIVYS